MEKVLSYGVYNWVGPSTPHPSHHVSGPLLGLRRRGDAFGNAVGGERSTDLKGAR